MLQKEEEESQKRNNINKKKSFYFNENQMPFCKRQKFKIIILLLLYAFGKTLLV